MATPVPTVPATSSALSSLWQLIAGHGRWQAVALTSLAVTIIALMVLPLPAAVLDALIAVNIGLSVLLLALALQSRTPLALSTFPTLLLFSTLLRLSLNIASTRAILLHAHAGDIIETFGRLVVGGSVVVGLVIFLVIAIVQFIVVAKGSERVAEVAARFTLDALPGRQMSIESELRAGQITAEQSRNQRIQLRRESQLYGAMDGAMKFVKGDAIAGLLIAAVNLLAGFVVGMALHGLPMSESLSTYTILTVGDGLVSQIPSLFVSLAAGVLITRVSGEGSRAPDLASEIASQISTQPRALLITAAVLFAFLFVPGFPFLQFLFWSVLFACTGLYFHRWTTQHGVRAEASRWMVTAPQSANDRRTPTSPEQGPLEVATRICVATSAQRAVRQGTLQTELQNACHEVALELGLPAPPLRIDLDDTLSDGQFIILVHGVPVRTSECEGLPLAAAYALALRQHAAELLGLQQTRQLLDQLQQSEPELVAEAIRVVPMTRMLTVLKRLLDEAVAIRNLTEILHALIEWSPREKDAVLLTEHVRNALARQLTYRYGGHQHVVHAVTLTRELEDTLRGAIKSSTVGTFFAIDPALQAALAEEARALLSRQTVQLTAPSCCVLTSMDIRRHVRRILDVLPEVPVVLSYQDLCEDTRIVGMGVLTGRITAR